MISNHKYFHWYYYHLNRHYQYNLFTGIFIWLFLSLTVPFGISNNNLPNYLTLILYLLPFGLSWPLISYLVDIIFRFIVPSKIFLNYRTDFKILLVKIFLLVHFVYVIRNYFCNWQCFDLVEYLELWFACLLLLVLTYIPFTFFAKYKYFQKMIGRDKDRSASLFEFKGSGKGTASVELDKVIYIKSDDNYVDIFLVGESGRLSTMVHRATLASMEEQLQAESQFMRIHRSYIINIQYLDKSSDKNTIKVRVNDQGFELPVSKKYQPDIAGVLK